MHEGFRLEYEGPPVPKGRPRVYQGHGVTPKRTRLAEARVRRLFREAYPDAEPLHGTVRLDAEFWMPQRGRPDRDNLLKLVQDALNGIAFDDDSQVDFGETSKFTPDALVMGVRGRLRKRKPGEYFWHGQPYEPHTLLIIRPVESPSASNERNQQ